MCRKGVPLIAMAMMGAASVAKAQSAQIVLAHDDPDGIVTPGQIVHIRATLSWSGPTEAFRIVGDAVASPDVGLSSAATGVIGASPSLHYGLPVLGSIRGVDLVNTLWSFGFSPWHFGGGMHFLEYDWTASIDPGIVEFNWTPHPQFPTPLFFTSTFTTIPLPTTYVGTSVTVIPGPGTPAVLAALATLAVGHRHRRCR